MVNRPRATRGHLFHTLLVSISIQTKVKVSCTRRQSAGSGWVEHVIPCAVYNSHENNAEYNSKDLDNYTVPCKECVWKEEGFEFR